MKVIGKQKNSKNCFICGLDNKFGVGAPFYNLEDGVSEIDFPPIKL